MLIYVFTAEKQATDAHYIVNKLLLREDEREREVWSAFKTHKDMPVTNIGVNFEATSSVDGAG